MTDDDRNNVHQHADASSSAPVIVAVIAVLLAFGVALYALRILMLDPRTTDAPPAVDLDLDIGNPAPGEYPSR